MNTKKRPMATCHPDRPHCAHGLCNSCDSSKRRKEKVVRTGLTYRQVFSKTPAICHPDRMAESHGLCAPCYQAQLRKKNLKRHRYLDREYSKRMPKIKRQSIRYKIPVEDIQKIFDAQGGKCAICKIADATHFDHSHYTGINRGLLCQKCNAGLGMFLDNTTFLASAIQYLERYAN